MNIFYCGMSPLSSRVLYTSLLYIPTYIKSFLTIIIAILLICRTCRHYYKIYNGYKVNYSSLKQIVWPTVPQKNHNVHDLFLSLYMSHYFTYDTIICHFGHPQISNKICCPYYVPKEL